jgi:RNA polymerase primary sigma factor
MNKIIDEKLLAAIDNPEDSFSVLARMIELGRERGYISLDDILHFFPQAEKDINQLEEAFSALLNAGIPYIEEAVEEPADEELEAEEKESEEIVQTVIVEDILANIDVDDTIGLYIKDVTANRTWSNVARGDCAGECEQAST